ncbi:MAG: hypothetical protein WCG35_00920 [Betaproteobacteria bacterium]
MKTTLKKLANTLTIAATLFLLIGSGYVLVKNQPLGDFVSEAAFCYLAIAVFNYLVFGAAILWHKKSDR